MEKSGFAQEIEVDLDLAIDMSKENIKKVFGDLSPAHMAQLLFVVTVDALSQMENTSPEHEEVSKNLFEFLLGHGKADALSMMDDELFYKCSEQEQKIGIVYAKGMVGKQLSERSQNIATILKNSPLPEDSPTGERFQKYWFSMGKFGQPYTDLDDAKKAEVDKCLKEHSKEMFDKLADGVKKIVS